MKLAAGTAFLFPQSLFRLSSAMHKPFFTVFYCVIFVCSFKWHIGFVCLAKWAIFGIVPKIRYLSPFFLSIYLNKRCIFQGKRAAQRSDDWFILTLRRTEYDHGVSTYSPEGRLFQVEYAIESIKVWLVARYHISSSDLLLLVSRLPRELFSL